MATKEHKDKLLAAVDKKARKIIADREKLNDRMKAERAKFDAFSEGLLAKLADLDVEEAALDERRNWLLLMPVSDWHDDESATEPADPTDVEKADA